MAKDIEFERLFVFDLANNHMGDVEHGMRVIRETRKATEGFPFRFGFKMQYRNLDTFIHPDYRGRKDIKYVKRFSETRLAKKDLKRLKDEITRSGFISVCTPFDEDSVGLIEEHKFDILKIASCSFTDWPLLERIAKTDMPIIASTAGAPIRDIDNVVAFLTHRSKKFCIMHCVGEYPTKNQNLKLDRIDALKRRYSDVPIGFSTHESPELLDAVKIAIGKGASVLERHVAVKTDRYGINAYSSTPEQVRNWLQAAAEAYEMCGTEKLDEVNEKELSDLRGLQRGIFAKERIRKGERVTPGNTFLAIPSMEGQVVANDISKYVVMTAREDIEPKGPVTFKAIDMKDMRPRVAEIVQKVKRIIVDSNIVLPNRIEVEISHHHGIEHFEECGATLISVINREYCKKLIILLPGQSHPVHTHKIKEETFHVLYGSMDVTLKGEHKTYNAGEMVTVERGMPHSFSSKTGAVFEEVSTTHHAGDSYYEDKGIMENKHRKTRLTYWSDW